MKDERKTPSRQAASAGNTLWKRCIDTIKNIQATVASSASAMGHSMINFMEEVDACAAEKDGFSVWKALRFLMGVPCNLVKGIHELKTKRFPETNHAALQLVYFALSGLPIVTNAVGNGVRHLLGKIATLQHKMPKTRRKPWHVAAFLTSSAVMAGVTVFFSLYTMGTIVQYGEVKAVVASETVAEEIITQVEQSTSSALGEAFTLDATQVEYTSEFILRTDIVEPEAVVEEVADAIGLVQEGYCLYVDGEFIGATYYDGALEELLDQVKSTVMNEDTISCEFAEEVEVVKEYIQDEQIVNLGYIAEILYSTKAGEVTYTVVSGDTWNAIAYAHDLTSDQLLLMNTGYNIDKLAIGDVLTISTAVPYLTVTVQQREHYVAQVPYAIEYTDSASMYQGDYSVTSAGSNGTADTVANVTYVNGVEVSRTVLSSVNLEDPVTEQRLQGTMERPTWMATGSFRWPTSGTITSYFGYRSAFSGASTYHQGLDIANGYGTAIYAADGGTVTYAGWQSGYGYLVEIDHGNGYTTRYGHNSSLLVSVGDKVYKGQQIAKMGSTGVSSGNHCHFEIRYNGTAKNPLSYLP
ncbi:M23 family metallopeptidase [Bengtsoniella intestinalis]|uniref:peptidoglycan DD-metalloendopeptidase family protein n=1 Tax=Bengtsoniella intestinalis TaxID=3073143 RepID=UPI00391F4891